MLIDTHCHIDITEQQGISIKEIIYNCIQNKILSIVQIAVDYYSSLWNKNFIENYLKNSEYSSKLKIFYTMGLHPESVSNSLQIEEIRKIILENKNDPYLIGIGETGLDFFQSPNTKEIQLESFYQHMKLAKTLELPVVIHSRDDQKYNENKQEAINLIYSIGKEIHYSNAIMHCYTYSYKEAKYFVDLGWKISFSGILTFKNANFIQETAKKIPLENILIETDSPFLAPVPYRGKTNQPAYVKKVFDYLVVLLNMPEQELQEIIIKNTMDIFPKMRHLLYEKI